MRGHRWCARVNARTDDASPRMMAQVLAALAAMSLAAAPTAARGDLDDPRLAGQFAGVVLGPDGQPVAGARLHVVPSFSKNLTPGPVRARTDAAGRFAFEAPDLRYTAFDGLPARRRGLIIAAADGYAPDAVESWGRISRADEPVAPRTEATSLVLRLGRDDVPVRGRIVDHEGLPIARAHVRLVALWVPRDSVAHARPRHPARFEDYRMIRVKNLLPGVNRDVDTDSDGRFTMPGLGRDRLAALWVSGPGIVNASFTVIVGDGPEVEILQENREIPQPGPFTLRLMAGYTVDGLVRDRDTLEPIAGMEVTDGRSDSVFTDAKGWFTLATLDPRDQRPQVRAWSPPGMCYLTGQSRIDVVPDVVIECQKGIPFRLKVVDEAGAAIDGDVEYVPVAPNSLFADWGRELAYSGWPLSVGVRKAPGVYEGFVMPGPGAVLVTVPDASGYRPAHVDPKAFFAPGRANWTDDELASTYGTHDTLSIGPRSVNQRDYAAIVLVDPPVGAKPLELTATLLRDRPRMVTLLDPEGQPVEGARAQGLTAHDWDNAYALRASTFPLTGLQPDRGRRITFVKEDRQLIGFLLARDDGRAPYIVSMRPWATLRGRFVDESGRPLRLDGVGNEGWPRLQADPRRDMAAHDDATIGIFPEVHGEAFEVERLVPGLRYRAEVSFSEGPSAGVAFEDVVLEPGELRDLGSIRVRPPANVPKH